MGAPHFGGGVVLFRPSVVFAKDRSSRLFFLHARHLKMHGLRSKLAGGPLSNDTILVAQRDGPIRKFLCRLVICSKADPRTRGSGKN
jgi:hypothetical protein